MLLSDVITILRNDYKLDVSLYSDATLTSLIDKACKKISEYFPKRELTSLVTTKDKTRYTVTHTGLMRLKAVYYMQGYDPGRRDNPFSDCDIPTTTPGSTYYPSQLLTLIKTLELNKELNPSGAEIISDCEFDLIPTPTEDGIKVYYEYEKFRAITDLGELFLEDVISLVFFINSDCDAQKKYSDVKGSQYQFERRGNITNDKTEVTNLKETRDKQLKSIVENIQRKVMKF